MKNTGRMKRFRNIVRRVVDDKDFDISRPRAMFFKAFMLFKKSEGISGKLSEREHQELREVFVRTLRLEGRKVKEGVLNTRILTRERPKRDKELSGIVTPAMMRGAREAQLRHDGVLKHDV